MAGLVFNWMSYKTGISLVADFLSTSAVFVDEQKPLASG